MCDSLGSAFALFNIFPIAIMAKGGYVYTDIFIITKEMKTSRYFCESLCDDLMRWYMTIRCDQTFILFLSADSASFFLLFLRGFCFFLLWVTWEQYSREISKFMYLSFGPLLHGMSQISLKYTKSFYRYYTFCVCYLNFGHMCSILNNINMLISYQQVWFY